jgi:hypothetical protein
MARLPRVTASGSQLGFAATRHLYFPFVACCELHASAHRWEEEQQEKKEETMEELQQREREKRIPLDRVDVNHAKQPTVAVNTQIER